MTGQKVVPSPPRGLKTRGRKFWREVNAELEMEVQELEMLAEVCRTLDHLAALDLSIRKTGAVDAKGNPVKALAEVRAQQLALARLFATLRLPDSLAAPDSRPQRRGSARGVYALPSPPAAAC